MDNLKKSYDLFVDLEVEVVLSSEQSPVSSIGNILRDFERFTNYAIVSFSLDWRTSLNFTL